jgi:signal transduction histidine kinase
MKDAVRLPALADRPPIPADQASSPHSPASEVVRSEWSVLGIICLLTALIFVFDIATPHDDVSISFLYTIPIFVTIFAHRWAPYPFALLTTVLSGVGAFIQTPGEVLDLVFFTNRTIAVVAHWLVAFLVATRKDAESLMRAEFEEQKRKIETGRRFMDVLSHEIGTSLTMIDGQAFRMRKLAENNEPLDTVVRADKIRQAVRHIEAVVRQVQLASEVGEGMVHFRPVAVPLGALVADAVQSEARPSIQANLTGLPEIVWGDADMLRQVIANLLSNAVKYSPPDAPVQVTGRAEQDLAVIAIADRGRGIPEDDKARLSEPYYRARNSHGVHGTGLGLYVARRFVASHGGTIDIASELGVGTTVTIRIPIGQPPSEESRGSTAHPLH